MKRKQYSVAQIVAALKQAELGMPVADLVRQFGISEQTYCRRKKQYAGLESNQVRELKQRQDENERLKKRVAELSLALAHRQTLRPTACLLGDQRRRGRDASFDLSRVLATGVA